ncbi:MAG: AI-2E family transporter [Gemmatimonadaceae bacterium]
MPDSNRTDPLAGNHEAPPPSAVTPPLELGEPALAPVPAEESPASPVAPPPVHSDRRRHATPWRSTDVLRTASLVVAMYMALRLLWFANALVITAFLGTLFGLAVSSGADWLARLRIPRGLGAATIVIGFFALLVGFGAWMAPTLREQGAVLRVKLPQAVDRVEEWINEHQNGLVASALRLPATVRPDSAAASRDSAATAASDTSTRALGPPSATETLRKRLGGQLSGMSRYLFPFLSSTLAAFTGLLIIVFLSIYIGADAETYHRGLMHLFPAPARTRAGEVLTAVATVLRKWLVTQLIAMLVIGAVTTIALSILQVKAAFALGVLAGLLEFIPTVGPILSAVPAIAMAFLDSPEKALTVGAVYIGIQFLENHILIPMLMRGGLDLPPALTILGQALFTLLFGFLGLMVAVPALAAIVVVVQMLYVEDVVGDDMRDTLDEEMGGSGPAAVGAS